ncbi:MAG: universal stress protein [Acidimicrobiales bacterium]
MYSTIVVGTDGSETAAEAVAVAADLARRTGATLHLVKAYQQSAGAMAVPVAGVAASDSGMGNALLAQDAEDVLADTAKTLDGISVERHAGSGAAADVLVSLAEQLHADLIVVGSKGMNRRILGSVPNSVAHSAPCAVLIVKTT